MLPTGRESENNAAVRNLKERSLKVYKDIFSVMSEQAWWQNKDEKNSQVIKKAFIQLKNFTVYKY